MLHRISLTAAAAVLLLAVCALQARALNEPTTVTVVFNNNSGVPLSVQLIGPPKAYALRPVAAGATADFVFKPNPESMTVQVEGCLPTHQLTIEKFYTRVYSRVTFTYGKDCRFSSTVNAP